MSFLEIKNLKKYFDVPRGTLHAVDDVTLSIEQGTTIGIVGEPQKMLSVCSALSYGNGGMLCTRAGAP